jgi:sugar-specific transcriptional regulator TrmB
VHRTLASLIEKGMVHPSLESPTIYAAVDLDTALGSALQKQQSELREMEQKSRELHELLKQQRFRHSDEVSTFKIIKNMKGFIAVSMLLLDALQEEWLAAAPAILTAFASLFGVNEAVSEFIKRGGKVRAIIDISYQVIEPVREMISIGEEVRHIDQHEITFVVFDKKSLLARSMQK